MATALEPGPFVHAAGAASVLIKGKELDDPVLVVLSAADDVEDLQTDPDRIVEGHTVWTGAGVPRAPQVVIQAQREGRVSRPHQRLGRGCLLAAIVEGFAAFAVQSAPARARAGIGQQGIPPFGPTLPAAVLIRLQRQTSAGTPRR